MDFKFDSGLKNEGGSSQRRALLAAYSKEQVACGVGSEVRIGYPLPSGGMRWEWVKPDMADGLHAYRTVLPNEIVFDLGDHTDWVETVANTHALWDVLNENGIRYWGCLSGGGGTHTHLFGPLRSPDDGTCMNCMHEQFHHDVKCMANEAGEGQPADFCTCEDYSPFPNDFDWRVRTAAVIISLASMRKWGTEFSPKLQADPLLLNPNFGSRQIREFGCQKEHGITHGPKALWTIGPSPYPPLPYSIAEAYAEAKGKAPEPPATVPRNELVEPAKWSGRQGWMHESCPVRPSCLVTQCSTCPRRDAGSMESKNTT